MAGIGIGWFNLPVFLGAFLLFLTNVAGILLAAALTFMFMGFRAIRRAQRGLLTSLVLVVVISIPLAFSFHRMVDEHRIIRRLDGWQVEDVTIRDVRILSMKPVRLSVQLISDQPIDVASMDRVKAEVEQSTSRRRARTASAALER